MATPTLQSLLGLSFTSSEIDSLTSGVDAEVKTYSDIAYFNYYTRGLTLQLKPSGSYKLKAGLEKNQLSLDRLIVDTIDIYNAPPSDAAKIGQGRASKKAELAFSSFPQLPITLESSDNELEVKSDTTGKDFVGTLGEPERKGGGAGPASGSINIWCEWTKLGIMVEFGGDSSRGPQAWERGKDSVWRVLTLFSPSE